MKILLFAMFGLSFYQANGDDGFLKPSTPDSEEHTCTTSPVPYANSEFCLDQLLRESKELLKDIGVYLCEYQACRKGEDFCNYENYKKTLTTFINAAACFGCDLDKILGTPFTFEDVLAEMSGSKFQVGALTVKLMESIGVAKSLADVLCKVFGGVLQSVCIQNALGNLAPDVVQHLLVLYCKEGDVEKETAENLADILKSTKCEMNTFLEPEDKLEDLLGSLGDTLPAVLGNVLIHTKQFPVVDNSLCTVLNHAGSGGGILKRK